MSVPEPAKGCEDDQDEEAPEPVLLIRLDEADALVHLRSMVSYRLSPRSTSLSSSLFHFPSSVMGLRGSGQKIRPQRHSYRVHFAYRRNFFLPRVSPAPTRPSENGSRASSIWLSPP